MVDTFDFDRDPSLYRARAEKLGPLTHPTSKQKQHSLA
jgi:hypothetical protein